MKTSTSFLFSSAIAAIGAVGGLADIAFVGSYEGTIETLNFDAETGTFTSVSSIDASPQPSWQELSSDKKFLYTVHEESGVTSFSVGEDGTLTKVSTADTAPGPVSLALSNDSEFIVTANYGSGSASVLSNDPATGEIAWIGDLQFGNGTNATTGEEAGSQPHQVLFDRTGTNVIIPDLAADLIRRFHFSYNETSVEKILTERAPVELPKDTGPRHGVFYPFGYEPEYYYVVAEKSNRVLSFKVDYSEDGLGLTLEKWIGTLPADYEDPANATQPAAAAEIITSPSSSGANATTFIYASNRFDTVYPNANSIAMYTVDARTDNLTFAEIYNSGVNNTRHFSIHPSGNWLINEGQLSNDLVTWELDPETGVPGMQQTSSFPVQAPVCLTWLD